jgi:TonB family protein
VRSLPPFLSVIWLLLAGCATPPAATDAAPWMDERAFRSCLGIKVPPELIRDQRVEKGSIVFDIDVLPSGRIEDVSIISGSGNARLDQYMVERLRKLDCAPFAVVDSTEPYSVELELEIQVDR